MNRVEVESQVEDIIWKNLHVLDDSGLHLGDAVEQIVDLIAELIGEEKCQRCSS